MAKVIKNEEFTMPFIETVDVADASKENLKVYSFETFDRSFPSHKDGLKPIHRRILYTMNKYQTYNFTKVANIVGRVMEYHPHGDSSIYGALVRLGQPWVMNYILVEIQGNKGNQDGDPAAAGRYIECKIPQFTKDVILDELDQVTVNYSDNYDYLSKVPDYLTTKIPLALINGINGIGEAYRCYIPPHNLNDIANKCIDYIKNKAIDNKILCDGLYPDFPTGGEILNGDELEAFYKYGKEATIQIRGKADLKPETNTLILTEFPYGIAIDNVTKAVKNQVVSGNMILSGIENIVDNNGNDDDFEVNTSKKKKKTVYEYECKKEANLVEILNEICRTTDFKTSIALSFMTNENGYPKYVTVKDIIVDWYKIRVDCKQRRHKNNISKAIEKLHLYEGILYVYDKLDDVIDTIRHNKDGKDALITKLHDKFGLTKAQADAIYSYQVGSLSAFGKVELEGRIKSLKDQIAKDDYILLHIDDVIISELEELKQKYGRPRKTTVYKNFKISDSERPVVSKGSFLYSLNEIGLYDSNGCKDSKSILTGMRPFKNSLGKNIKEITGGCSFDKAPIAFAVCYSDATIQRIDSSVFKILNVWYDTKCDEKDNTRTITAACPIFNEDDELLCLSDDLKLKRILSSELNKRAVGSGSVIISIANHDKLDPNKIDYMLAGTSVNKKGNPIPSYSIAPIEEIPLVSRAASGVKSSYEKDSMMPNTTVKIIDICLDSDENSRVMVGAIDSKDQQSYIYSIPTNELSMTGRTNKPKSLALPEGYVLSSVDLANVSDKEQVICMIGKNNTSTLSVTNFKKPYSMKKTFLITMTSGVL